MPLLLGLALMHGLTLGHDASVIPLADHSVTLGASAASPPTAGNAHPAVGATTRTATAIGMGMSHEACIAAPRPQHRLGTPGAADRAEAAPAAALAGSGSWRPGLRAGRPPPGSSLIELCISRT